MNALLTPEVRAKIIAILKKISIPEDSVEIIEDEEGIHITISERLQVDVPTIQNLVKLIPNSYCGVSAISAIQHKKLILSSSLLRISLYK